MTSVHKSVEVSSVQTSKASSAHTLCMGRIADDDTGGGFYGGIGFLTCSCDFPTQTSSLTTDFSSLPLGAPRTSYPLTPAF